MTDEPRTNDSDDELNFYEDDQGDRPFFIVPSTGTLGPVQSGAIDTFASSMSAPDTGPMASPTDEDTVLAARVEETLAEDGRFSSLFSGLTIVSNAGIVEIGGFAPTVALKQDLFEAARSVRGVTGIHDRLILTP